MCLHSQGARLCTAAEMFAGVGWGSGCGYNQNTEIWTSTECESGHISNMKPPGPPLQTAAVQTCMDDSSINAIRCCADVESSREGLLM